MRFPHSRKIVTFHFQYVIIFSLSLLGISSACFIANCPPGGKRSGNPYQDTTRKCTSCGPPGQGGECYGAQICCSKEYGCLIGTPGTEECLVESQLTSPCQNTGKSCGGIDESQPINGHCASNGICCSSEVCTRDPSCHAEPHVSEEPIMEEKPPTNCVYPFDQDDDCLNPFDILSSQEVLSSPNSRPYHLSKLQRLLMSLASPAKETIELEDPTRSEMLPPIQLPKIPSIWAVKQFPVLNSKRYFLDDEHSSQISKNDDEKRNHRSKNINSNSNTNNNNNNNNSKGNFGKILKSGRPGWNSLVRKLLQVRKRNHEVLQPNTKKE